MAKNVSHPSQSDSITLEKSPTGIKGFDDIVGGGVPRGRTTLVCGGPGCGKTLFATEFLVRGAQEFNEPGVFIAFEETESELAKNVASLGINLPDLIARGKLFIDYVYIERSEIEETGEYDLEGLFIRLGYAIDSIGAKRVVLDTLETIFAGFDNDSILRSEIRRLFRWLKDKGVTAIVTGEQGEKNLTRYGLEEYVSDCVVRLENRVENKISNRILRVVKYRGTAHGTDEYPFLIGNEGIWVQPITSLGLNYQVSDEQVSSGVAGLDEMLSGKGYYKGSSVLISGTAGTGKTSLSAAAVLAACGRGERCLYFAFEEATNQIVRNMRSIGMNLQPYIDQGLLVFRAARPSVYGIEMHLLAMEKLVEEVQPALVVIDPLTDLVANNSEVKSMLTRLIDFLKVKQITAIFTTLTVGGENEISSEVGISSLIDTWILVRNLESNGEQNRGLYVLKSRGMAHSTQVREFCLSDKGIDLVDVYVGPEGILTGSARIAQEAREESYSVQREAEALRKKRELELNRKVLQNRIAVLQAEIDSEIERYEQTLVQDEQRQKLEEDVRGALAKQRQTGEAPSQNGSAK